MFGVRLSATDCEKNDVLRGAIPKTQLLFPSSQQKLLLQKSILLCKAPSYLLLAKPSKKKNKLVDCKACNRMCNSTGTVGILALVLVLVPIILIFREACLFKKDEFPEFS